MQKRKRIVWIDQLKALDFYTIILCHMSINTDFKCWMASFNLPLFFIISGFNYNIQKVQRTSFVSYVSKQAKRILVPYFWLQMLSFILRYMVNILGKHKEVAVITYLKGIIIGNNNITNAPSNPLYSVLMLFLAYLGLWLVVKLTKGNKTGMGFVLLTLTSVSVVTRKVNLPWHINGIPNVMLLIFIGRLLMDVYKLHKEMLEKLNNGAYFSACGVLLVTGYLLNLYNGRISIHGNFYGQEYYIYIICAVVSSVAFSMLAMKMPHSKLLSFIGMNTFFYLGIHKPLLLVMETVFSEYESHGVFLVIGSLACYFGLAPVAWIANKYFPYICGNPIKEETLPIKIGKYLAIAAAGAVPYLYFNNHFMEGVLRTTLPLMIASTVAYLILVLLIERAFTKFIPFMFLQERKK